MVTLFKAVIDLVQIFGSGVPEVSGAALFLLLFFGTFVSEDAACLAAGAAAANGRIELPLAILACFLGIFAGDMLLYCAGRRIGDRLFSSRITRRFVSEASEQKARTWLSENSGEAVFLSRFVTGLRLPTYLLAGALRTDLKKFSFFFLLAAAIWTPLLVSATAYSQSLLFQNHVILGIIIMAILLRSIIKFSSGRNRRLVVGRIKRFANWEFWPIQLFYAPVIAYIFFLGIKHRSLTAFTAANPGIPAGGFRGESKHEIYKELSASEPGRRSMLRYLLLSPEKTAQEKMDEALRFISNNSLSYPVVIKPDAGERGKDVNIVHDQKKLEDTIFTLSDDALIIQEFAPGHEVSVFYYRYPNESRGQIFSVTEKLFPTLEGDGVSNIEGLILNDPRAVCLAEKYFEQNRARLAEVPGKGERLRLIELGTHSKGAIFLEGRRLMTPDLTARIDEIAKGFHGFYFGRFDIRVTDLDSLSAGEGLKIIELNGVTSESTNIYDPRYSLLDAYRILFSQWRIAFEIGEQNSKLEAHTTGVMELIRLGLNLRQRPV